MKIFISGGTGFVGTYLTNSLLDKGHHVTAAGTSGHHPAQGRNGFELMSCDTTQAGKWQEAIGDMDAVINLAGRNIFKFWTKKYKSLMYDSRILTTINIVNALPKDKKTILLSTSAVGCYGNRGDEMLNENSSPGDGFLARVCQDWEREAAAGEEKGARVVIMRFGVVLGRNGGALANMIPAFKWFVGGPLGNGTQWFPWIHMADLTSAVYFMLESEVSGPMNLCAPSPVRQKDFAKALGKSLGRPAFMPTPAFILRALMGEMGASLMASQRVVPEKLLDEGFRFSYPNIQDALQDLMT